MPTIQEIRITPTSRRGLPRVGELFEFRDFFLTLLRRDFLYKYRQTWLGSAWFVLQPLLTASVFVLVFDKIVRLPTGAIPSSLFYLSSFIVWHYFTQGIEAIRDCLRSHSSLLAKVYFPRLLLPASIAVSRLFTLALQLGVFLLFFAVYLYRGKVPTAPLARALFFVPGVVGVLTLLAFGVGLWLAVLTVRFRDFAVISQFLLPLWMYTSPVLYPASAVPQGLRPWLAWNPMTAVLEGWRLAWFGTGQLTAFEVAQCLGTTAVLVLTGAVAFHWVEKDFIDRV